jgi:hypothetical protein
MSRPSSAYQHALIIATAIALLFVGGCGRDTRRLMQGVRDVSNHAKAIEEAAEPNDGRSVKHVEK